MAVFGMNEKTQTGSFPVGCPKEKITAMTNQQHNKEGPPTPGKWQVDHFTIRMCHAEYIDSMEDTPQLLAYRQQYEVKYDVELFFPGDVVSMRMHALVNGEGSLPGYRIACTVQTDYELLGAHQDEITKDQITPGDMDFFIADTHLSLQDHILALTESMPLGAYIMPPPDLDGAIGKEIDDLLKDE